MRRTLGVVSAIVIGVLAFTAWQQGPVQAQAPAGRGGAAAAEARAKQEAAEKATPKLQITEEILPLDIPDHTIGETEGVSLNS